MQAYLLPLFSCNVKPDDMKSLTWILSTIVLMKMSIRFAV